MAERTVDAAALIDPLAEVMGLVIEPAFRPGVVANFQLAMAMAELLGAVPTADDQLPAAVYEVGR